MYRALIAQASLLYSNGGDLCCISDLWLHGRTRAKTHVSNPTRISIQPTSKKALLAERIPRTIGERPPIARRIPHLPTDVRISLSSFLRSCSSMLSRALESNKDLGFLPTSHASLPFGFDGNRPLGTYNWHFSDAANANGGGALWTNHDV